MKNKSKMAVAVVIEDDSGKVLLVKRGKISRDAIGKWENCGGEVDENETDEEAIKREVKEEMVCDLEVTGVLYKDTFVTDQEVSWQVTIFSGKISGTPKIQNPDENSDVQWFAKEELKNLDLASYTRKDFEKFGWI